MAGTPSDGLFGLQDMQVQSPGCHGMCLQGKLEIMTCLRSACALACERKHHPQPCASGQASALA